MLTSLTFPPAKGSTRRQPEIPPNVLLMQSTQAINRQGKLDHPRHNNVDAVFLNLCKQALNEAHQAHPRIVGVFVGNHSGQLAVQVAIMGLVSYDATCRYHIEEMGQRDWSKVDPSIYARYFMGWARPSSWYSQCQMAHPHYQYKQDQAPPTEEE